MQHIFDRLWDAYAAITPQARRVRELLAERGETVRTDHIAFRTFDLAPIDLEHLAKPWESKGWVRTGEYRFEAKKLRAVSLSRTGGDWPRVFISELVTGQLPDWVGEEAGKLVAKMAPIAGDPFSVFFDEPSWPRVPGVLYEKLLAVSQYAAWLAAFGIRANHFTVDVNALTGTPDIAAMNQLLLGEGFRLNEAGGAVKGGPDEGLAQSATLADEIPWPFADRDVRKIPSCYYEFAQRFPDPETGELFEGFVTASADRIFESTDACASRVIPIIARGSARWRQRRRS